VNDPLMWQAPPPPGHDVTHVDDNHGVRWVHDIENPQTWWGFTGATTTVGDRDYPYPTYVDWWQLLRRGPITDATEAAAEMLPDPTVYVNDSGAAHCLYRLWFLPGGPFLVSGSGEEGWSTAPSAQSDLFQSTYSQLECSAAEWVQENTLGPYPMLAIAVEAARRLSREAAQYVPPE